MALTAASLGLASGWPVPVSFDAHLQKAITTFNEYAITVKPGDAVQAVGLEEFIDLYCTGKDPLLAAGALFQSLVDNVFDGAVPVLSRIQVLLDAAIDCVLTKKGPAGLPFLMLEDCIERAPLHTCMDLWLILESRREVLTKPPFLPLSVENTRSKMLLLSLANRLLRRLSHSQDAIFIGRILMFLSYAFPLAEPSALNPSGKFNVSNVTTWDEAKDVSMDGSDSSVAVDRTLYQTFWHMQSYATAPQDALKSIDAWKQFVADMRTVLEALSTSGVRAVSDADDADLGDFFSLKYLTSMQVFTIALQDPGLRRHVLVQFLIWLRWYSAQTITLAGVQAADDIKSLQTDVLALLRQSNPGGKQLADIVTHILDTEDWWAKWKSTKCLSYERYPAAADAASTPAAAPEPKPFRPAGRRGEAAPIVKPWAPESLSRDFLAGCVQAEPVRPSLDSFLQRLRDAEDPDNEIEDEYNPKHNKLYVWKTKRLITETHLSAIAEMSQTPFETVSMKLDVGKSRPAGSAAADAAEESKGEDEQDGGATTGQAAEEETSAPPVGSGEGEDAPDVDMNAEAAGGAEAGAAEGGEGDEDDEGQAEGGDDQSEGGEAEEGDAEAEAEAEAGDAEDGEEAEDNEQAQAEDAGEEGEEDAPADGDEDGEAGDVDMNGQ